MNAVRGARAFTGRSRIAKMEGGYHGSADEMLVPGGTTLLPFNDVRGAQSILEAEGNGLAAVLVEPVLGSAGMIPAERDYLRMLREVTRRFGILLVFDEVVSLRVAYGGAQDYFEVSPDLTLLGKLIGGGFPLGAFGGREDIMKMFDPSRGRPAIPHPGSYNANPIGMVAGATTMELLTREAIDRLNQLGADLRAELVKAFTHAGIIAQITGMGSLFAIHLNDRPVRSYPDTLGARADLSHEIFLGLFNEGVLIDPRGVGCLSTVTGEDEIDRFKTAIRAVLSRTHDSGKTGSALLASRL